MIQDQINTIIRAAKSGMTACDIKAMTVATAKTIRNKPAAGTIAMNTNKGVLIVEGCLLGKFGLVPSKSGYRLTIRESGLGVGLTCCKSDAIHLLKLANAIAAIETETEIQPLLLLLTSILNRVRDNGDYVDYL